MASKREIEINFKQAKEQAKKLEEAAMSMKKMNGEFETTLGNIKSNWVGESSNLYVRKGAELHEDMSKTASDLQTLADTIRRIAKRIYEAEMRALREARK